MGRKKIDVKYNGISLYANVAGREIRVTRDVKKKQNTTNYRLVDSTKPRYIFQSTDLNLVKKHYDKYIADLSYKIDVPAAEITPTNKSEIKISWLHFFDKDEEILKYLFDFYDEKHFLETEEGKEPRSIERLADSGCQAAADFKEVQLARELLKGTDYEPFIYNLNSQKNEAYLIYRNTSEQPMVLTKFARSLNSVNNVNDLTKEELRATLRSDGVVAQNDIDKDENLTGLIVVPSIDKYYSNNIYKAVDGRLILAQRQITPTFIIHEFMTLLEKEPDTVCKISGVKEFGYLKNILPKKTISLKQVGEYYFERQQYTAQNAIEINWKRNMQCWWKEFLLITNAVSLNDITLQTINDYQLEIYKVYNDNKYLPAWLTPKSKKLLKITPAMKNWIKKRFDCVATVFTNLLKIVEDTSDVDRVLSYLKKLQLPPDTEKFNPKPMSRDDFTSLFKATEQIEDEKMKLRWKCILLLSLNTASYFKDLADIKKEHIDLDNKTLIMMRQKKKTLKVAKLWDITVNYVKELRKSNNNTEFEIISNTGNRYSPVTMRNYYRNILKTTAKVGAEFNSIRDGACYAMANGGIRPEIRKMVMGHKTDKIQDRYLKRDGAIVSDAAKAIYEYYGIRTLDKIGRKKK